MCCPDSEQGSQPWTKPSQKGPPQRSPARGLTRNHRVRFVSVCTKLEGPWIGPKQSFLLGWQKVAIQDRGLGLSCFIVPQIGVFSSIFFFFFSLWISSPWRAPWLATSSRFFLLFWAGRLLVSLLGDAPLPHSTPGAVALNLLQHNRNK